MMCELGVNLKNYLDKNPAFLGEKGGVVHGKYIGVILSMTEQFALICQTLEALMAPHQGVEIAKAYFG